MPAAAPPSAPPTGPCPCCGRARASASSPCRPARIPTAWSAPTGRTRSAACSELARPLVDVIWELETEGKPADTPERRASIKSALLARVGTIADGSVQSYYRSEMFERLDKAYRPPPSARWQVGGRRPFVRGGRAPEPAPFPAGTAARLAGTDLDSSRQERALLGALIERPCPAPCRVRRR